MVEEHGQTPSSTFIAYTSRCHHFKKKKTKAAVDFRILILLSFPITQRV